MVAMGAFWADLLAKAKQFFVGTKGTAKAVAAAANHLDFFPCW
jgi:hypothetical protein